MKWISLHKSNQCWTSPHTIHKYELKMEHNLYVKPESPFLTAGENLCDLGVDKGFLKQNKRKT